MTTTPPDTQIPEFSITRVLNAPPQLVWRAWIEEAELAQWLRPFGVSTDSVSFDVRVGGKYAYTMTNEETAEKFPTGGTFLEIEPMRRLAFTWGDPEASAETAAVITLTFAEHDEGTELVFHLRGYDGKPGDGFVYDGWDEALTNLERHLTGKSVQ